MHKEYVTIIEGVCSVGDTQVSLDSLVYLFREGMSAESMVECYPALTLEQVPGALAFYLGNQKRSTYTLLKDSAPLSLNTSNRGKQTQS